MNAKLDSAFRKRLLASWVFFFAKKLADKHSSEKLIPRISTKPDKPQGTSVQISYVRTMT